MRKRNYAILSSLLPILIFSACSQESDRQDLNTAVARTGGNTSLETCAVSDVKEPVRSHYEAGEVTALCEKAIAKTEQRLTEVGAEKKDGHNVENTLLAFETTMADFSDEISPLTFMGYVSTDEKVAAEGSECEQKVGQFYVDIFTRRPLYTALASLKTEQPEQSRLLLKTLESFEQNGLKLSDETLAQVKELKSQLAAKESQFSTNLNVDASSVSFTAEQLKGAPADLLERVKKTEDGKFVITTKSTDYLDVMENVSVAETRKAMMLAYMNRGGDANTKLLEEAVQLRASLAKALGYKTWADYRTTTRMAKNSESVFEFLNNLKGKLAIRNQQDQKQLLTFKKELDPKATSLDQWDIAYLSYQLQKRDYSLDNEKIREYFPAETVVAGIFDVYSKLLGVTYTEVKDARVWADGVKLYEIHDSKDCRLLGRFYADLIPRAGKYGHAAAFPLTSGRMLQKDQYSFPVASIVANFTAPTAGKPSLLTHDEVDTFFHEFGHIMHQTLTRAPYASLSGAGVAQDFVEAPSQMLENWVWNPEIIAKISGHYLHPEQKLPADLLEKMLEARNFQQGAAYTKQLLYALFDLTLHTQEGPVDVTQTYDRLYREIIGQEPLAGNHFPASFGHLMGGYDAGYYGYLWSEVYAQDMFSKFPANDLTNSEIGGRYRQVILEQGNMKEAIDLLKEFLGREPSTEAFFKMLGL